MDFSGSVGPGLGFERFEAFGDSREILPELLHRPVAVDRLLGQGLADDLVQLGRQAPGGPWSAAPASVWRIE